MAALGVSEIAANTKFRHSGRNSKFFILKPVEKNREL